jgi:predicted DNA-binding protein (MmcQ/YjbR family)
VIKVKGKVFLFLGKHEEKLGLSVKLPSSATFALGLPFASPTRYGLGKSGWVTARFALREKLPLDLLMKWIDESYRAVAPNGSWPSWTGAPSAVPCPGPPKEPRKALK